MEITHKDGPVTAAQLDLINQFVRQGHLSRADFTDDREYRRKRTMNRQRAHILIRLGISRQTQARKQ